MTIHTTKDGVTLLVDLPEKKEVRYAQPSLVKACRGNKSVAEVLDYFVYAASREAKEKGLPKGCKVVTVTRTHDKIMQGLQHPPSRKTLIRYTGLLNEWKLVLSQPYQREFTVDLETIQQAINNPPQVPPPVRRLHEKGCRSTTFAQKATTLPHSELDYEKVVKLYTELAEEVTTLKVEHAKKVEELQQKVVDLHKKVEELQLNVDNLQHYNVASDGSTPDLTGAKNEPPIYTYILPILTNKEESGAVAPSPAHDQAINFTASEEKEALGDTNGSSHHPGHTGSVSVQPLLPTDERYSTHQDTQRAQVSARGSLRVERDARDKPGRGTNTRASGEQITLPAYSQKTPQEGEEHGDLAAVPAGRRDSGSADRSTGEHSLDVTGEQTGVAWDQKRAALNVSADTPTPAGRKGSVTPSQPVANSVPGGKNSRKTAKVEKQLPLPIVLTPSQQVVWDEWCKMPWFKGVAPKMQSNDQDHLTKLTAYKPDAKSMLAVKNWATSRAVDKKGWFATRGWSLYYLVQEYPKWLSIQDSSDTTTHHTDQTAHSASYKNMSKTDLIAYILALPTGMRAGDPKYKELTDSMMYLTMDEKREVTLQRRALQMQRTSAMAFAAL